VIAYALRWRIYTIFIHQKYGSRKQFKRNKKYQS